MAAWAKKRLLVTGVIVAVTISFLLWSWLRPGDTTTGILQSFGYLEMIPPSRFHGPGTINTIEVISHNKIKLHPTCEMDAQTLSNLAMSSSTVEQTIMQNLDNRFNISSQVKSIISSAISGNQVKDILIKLNNVKILLMSDEHLFELQQQFIKGICQEVIAWNLKSGAIVCQTRAVLEADVVYKIVYKENVSVKEKGDITRNVASKLELATEEGKEDEITGRKLFYGVRLHPYGLISNTSEAKPTECLNKL